jgi:hypothetical protein
MRKEFIDERNLSYLVDPNGKSVIRKGKKELEIQDTIYLSKSIFEELYYEEYKHLLDKENCCDLETKTEFIQECLREEEFTDLGGILVFFIKKGPRYKMVHSDLIKEIK